MNLRALIFIAAALAMGLGWVLSGALLLAGFVVLLTGIAMDLHDPHHQTFNASDALRDERAARAALHPRTGVVDVMASRERH